MIEDIRNKSLEEVYDHIKKQFIKIPDNIQTSLEDYFNKFPYWGKINRLEGNYEELYNRAKSLKEHLDDYIWLYNKLQDYRSKKVLFSILNNWYNFDFETLNTSIERNYPHYFDLDIVKCDENEVFIDLGSYVGDTVLDYFSCYGANCYKKIYCYEITKSTFNILKNNLSYYQNIDFINMAISDKKGKKYIEESNVEASANMTTDNGTIEVNATTIDDDIKEKISLIKMDIEGDEQKALIGCTNHIKNEHPKLLISVYHNHEDLWKVPRMIDEMYPNYKFYLRYYGNNIFPTEIVLMAI